MRRVVVLGRGGAGKSVLSRQLGELTGLPVIELDAVFWQPGAVPMDAAGWAASQRELVRGDAWILDGDLGPYDQYLDIRLQAADTVIVQGNAGGQRRRASRQGLRSARSGRGPALPER